MDASTRDRQVRRSGADERPCPEVIDSLDQANQTRAETFGSGPEGRSAMTTIIKADVGPQLEGVAERSSEGDGWVESYDEPVDCQGWVMVEQAETVRSGTTG